MKDEPECEECGSTDPDDLKELPTREGYTCRVPWACLVRQHLKRAESWRDYRTDLTCDEMGCVICNADDPFETMLDLYIDDHWHSIFDELEQDPLFAQAVAARREIRATQVGN